MRIPTNPPTDAPVISAVGVDIVFSVAAGSGAELVDELFLRRKTALSDG